MRIISTVCFFLSGLAASAAPELSNLTVEQPITVKAQLFTVTPSLKISFTLAAPASVTVQIKRHLAAYVSFKGPYLQEPYLVRTLAIGNLPAGPQTVDWDGLDDHGQPLTETHNLDPGHLLNVQPRPTTPQQLTETVPVNFVQVVVKAGGEELTENFERGVGPLTPNRQALPFRSAANDKDGNYVIADNQAWWVYAYSPNFSRLPEKMWPKVVPNMAPDASPVEVQVVHLDSHGNVLAMTVGGIYRFAPDGLPQKWPHQDSYIPGAPTGNVLGQRSNDLKIGAQPGFSSNLGGFDLDEKDTIYLSRTTPDPCIEVFDDDGKYLRRIPVPAGKTPRNIAWLGNNTLALGANDGVYLLDAGTGAVKKAITDAPSGFSGYFLQVDHDKNIYAGSNPIDLYRFTSAGDKLPFNTALPAVFDKTRPHRLLLHPGYAHLPVGTPGFSTGVCGFAFAPDGTFYASTNSTDGGTPSDLLHFAHDGTFLPDNLLFSWGSHTLGNVFLDDAPATVAFYVTNFTGQPQPFTVHWTLTDFYEKKTTGTVDLQAGPMARQTVSFTVPVPAVGHYRLETEIRQGDKFVEKLSAQLARIPSRSLATDRYSPFAVVWIGEYELMSLIGVKTERADTISWASQVEPLDGIFYPNHPEVPQYVAGGPEVMGPFARRWGMYMLNMLNYGENWLGGDWYAGPAGGGFVRIFSYDRFYDYCLHVLDFEAGKGEAFYQFWNEPDDFWHVPGPFSAEHYTVVDQNVWSMIKARDKNAMSVPDGDPGAESSMATYASFGSAPYFDAVLFHYPGATVLSISNISYAGLPESKDAAVQKVIDIRDKLFPGKQVWNTEENLPINDFSPATNMVRNYLSQIALGVDKVYLFSQTGTGAGHHDVRTFLDENSQPFPTYVSYATMTGLIDGSVFCGSPDFGPGAYGYLFARRDDFVLAANCLAGTKPVTIDTGAPSVTIVDLMGRSLRVATDSGKLNLTLTPDVQYVLLPRNGGAIDIARAALTRQLSALQLPDASAIPAAADEAAKTAATDGTAMNRLYHLVKAAELAAAAGQAPPRNPGSAAPSARRAVETAEGADGYSRAARVALDWTDRLAQEAGRDPSMGWAYWIAANETGTIASSEAPVYPGVAINAFIGEPGEIEKIRAIVPTAGKQDTTIDDKFRFQIDRKPGDPFEMELTVHNFYRHPISGTLTPRLPDGWQASPASTSYSVAAGKWQRFNFKVTIPANAKTGTTFTVGGETTYRGAAVQELHPDRIKL